MSHMNSKPRHHCVMRIAIYFSVLQLFFVMKFWRTAVAAASIRHTESVEDHLWPEIKALKAKVCGDSLTQVIQVHPHSFLSTIRFDLPAKILYGRLQRLKIRSKWGQYVYREHLSALNNFQEKRFEQESNTWDKDGEFDFYFAFNALLEDVANGRFRNNDSIVPTILLQPTTKRGDGVFMLFTNHFYSVFCPDQSKEILWTEAQKQADNMLILIDGAHRVAALFVDALDVLYSCNRDKGMQGPKLLNTIYMDPQKVHWGFDSDFFVHNRSRNTSSMPLDAADAVALEQCQLRLDTTALQHLSWTSTSQDIFFEIFLQNTHTRHIDFHINEVDSRWNGLRVLRASYVDTFKDTWQSREEAKFNLNRIECGCYSASHFHNNIGMKESEVKKPLHIQMVLLLWEGTQKSAKILTDTLNELRRQSMCVNGTVEMCKSRNTQTYTQVGSNKCAPCILDTNNNLATARVAESLLGAGGRHFISNVSYRRYLHNPNPNTEKEIDDTDVETINTLNASTLKRLLKLLKIFLREKVSRQLGSVLLKRIEKKNGISARNDVIAAALRKQLERLCVVGKGANMIFGKSPENVRRSSDFYNQRLLNLEIITTDGLFESDKLNVGPRVSDEIHVVTMLKSFHKFSLTFETIDEILFNPEHHFYFRGIKFVSPKAIELVQTGKFSLISIYGKQPSVAITSPLIGAYLHQNLDVQLVFSIMNIPTNEFKGCIAIDENPTLTSKVSNPSSYQNKFKLFCIKLPKTEGKIKSVHLYLRNLPLGTHCVSVFLASPMDVAQMSLNILPGHGNDTVIFDIFSTLPTSLTIQPNVFQHDPLTQNKLFRIGWAGVSNSERSPGILILVAARLRLWVVNMKKQIDDSKALNVHLPRFEMILSSSKGDISLFILRMALTMGFSQKRSNPAVNIIFANDRSTDWFVSEMLPNLDVYLEHCIDNSCLRSKTTPDSVGVCPVLPYVAGESVNVITCSNKLSSYLKNAREDDTNIESSIIHVSCDGTGTDIVGNLAAKIWQLAVGDTNSTQHDSEKRKSIVQNDVKVNKYASNAVVDIQSPLPNSIVLPSFFVAFTIGLIDIGEAEFIDENRNSSVCISANSFSTGKNDNSNKIVDRIQCVPFNQGYIFMDDFPPGNFSLNGFIQTYQSNNDVAERYGYGGVKSEVKVIQLYTLLSSTPRHLPSGIFVDYVSSRRSKVRGDIIISYLKNRYGTSSFSMVDIGSDQGYFSIRTAFELPQSIVLSIEGQDAVTSRVKWNMTKHPIKHHMNIIHKLQLQNNQLCNSVLDLKHIKNLSIMKKTTRLRVDVLLLLSVFHWFPLDPATAAEYLSYLMSISEIIFFEIPGLVELETFSETEGRDWLYSTLATLAIENKEPNMAVEQLIMSALAIMNKKGEIWELEIIGNIQRVGNISRKLFAITHNRIDGKLLDSSISRTQEKINNFTTQTDCKPPS